MMRRLVVGLAFGLIFLVGMAATALTGTAQTPKVIKISVKKFEYSVQEITVKKGMPVVIELTSLDRQHGFSLPAFGVRGDVNPGEVTRIAFTPDKPGRFAYLCDVFCGEGHEEVTGTLIVTE